MHEKASDFSNGTRASSVDLETKGEARKGRMTREPESDHEDDPVNARDPEVGVR